MKNLNVGFSFPFRFNDGRVATVGGKVDETPTNQDLDNAARESARQIILTGKGERVMLGQFGAGVDRYLFSSIARSLSTFIENDVEEQIRFWSGRARVVSVAAAAEPARKEIAVDLRLAHNDRDGDLFVNMKIGQGMSGG